MDCEKGRKNCVPGRKNCADVNDLRKGQEEIKSRLIQVEQKVDRLIENQASMFEMLGDHDVAIRTWRRENRKAMATALP